MTPRILHAALTGLGLLAVASTSAMAGPIHSWNWNGPADGGSWSNNGGTINWVSAEFDTNTQRLRYSTNFGDGSRLKTDGFTLALTPGNVPSGQGEVALLYFDAKAAFTFPGEVPTLTAYSYNGLGDFTSHEDGSSDAGMQAPDRIVSSQGASTSWAYDVDCRVEADGTRSMNFDIDIAAITGHSPLHGSSNPWQGIGMGEEVGIWMNSFASLNSAYSGDYLSTWDYDRMGYLEGTFSTTGVEPVPEPATLALLGLGGISLFGARFRRKKNPKA